MDSIWKLPEARWRNPRLKILLPSKLLAMECSPYPVPSLCNQGFCPGLSLHQPVPSLFAQRGSHTCTASHTKFSELDAGWSGKLALTREWTAHQPTAHKITYLSGYIFKMQLCPPQHICIWQLVTANLLSARSVLDNLFFSFWSEKWIHSVALFLCRGVQATIDGKC